MLKRDPEWTAGNAMLDQEHDKFFDLASRLLAVVRVNPGAPLAREAIDIFYQRLALHTAAEESLAAKSDRETARILREDHQEMLASLKQLSASIGRVRPAEVVSEMERIVEVIAKHEREVDVPLFRLISSR